MARQSNTNTKLGFIDIVLNADSEVIKQAYEARLKIDGLLVEREEAYRRINELEEQIEEIVGEESLFPFPPPPLPIAGFSKPVAATRSKSSSKKASPKTAPSKSAETSSTSKSPEETGATVSAEDDSRESFGESPATPPSPTQNPED
jgi:hypothetical protein